MVGLLFVVFFFFKYLMWCFDLCCYGCSIFWELVLCGVFVGIDDCSGFCGSNFGCGLWFRLLYLYDFFRLVAYRSGFVSVVFVRVVFVCLWIISMLVRCSVFIMSKFV